MSAPIQAGEILAGKYKVEGVLGAGGMGVVVAARHLQLGERFAIKFLLPQALARQDVVARFLREGQAAARIRSEHVARVVDVGTFDDGEPYLVMEYLEGSDLSTLLRAEGPFPIEEAVELVLQACEALADAHALGIIHRDLKPGNLFLTQRSDGTPSIKIIDFGISKVTPAETDDPDAVEMTNTAVMMGSPLYMSPEQMASARDVDVRTDIWSLGIILHSLLTGAPPFKGASVIEIYELFQQGPPKLRSVRPSAPEGLENVILRCLQKDRRERYADVAELAAALVPFGPPHAHLSAERCARILHTKTPTTIKSTPPPASARAPLSTRGPISVRRPPPLFNTDGPEFPDETRPSEMRPSLVSLAELATPMAPPPSTSTDAPWGQRTTTPERPPFPLIVALLVGALVIAAGIIIFLLRGQSAPPSSPTTPSSEVPASAHPTSAPAAEQEPPSVAPATPSETATASAAKTATPSARAPVTGRAPRPTAADTAGKAPPVKAPPKKDLFSEPR